MSTTSSSNLCFAPLPILTGTDYKHWKKKMETFFKSQDLWNLIENGKTTTPGAGQPQITNELLVEIEEQRKDNQALYYIQQSVAPNIFPMIIAASSAKAAWDVLKAEYNTNFVEQDDFHAIQIPEEELDKSWPKNLIDNISKNIRDGNPTAYTPQLISIGPLHRTRPELANMEKRKFYYAKNFLDRTQKQKVLFVKFIKEREKSIRDSYKKPSDLDSRAYVEMILLDSFFIFELFIRCQNKSAIEYAGDSLLHELWYRDNILFDLLFFENQLPFCLLSELYQFSFDANDPERSTFVNLCLTYFTVFNHKQIMLHEDECKKQLHFTGLVRRFNCTELHETKESIISPSLKYGAKKLFESRVKFYGIPDGSLTNISFKKRVFKLPRFKIDNTTERICRNLMGLEQHQFKDKAYICSYINLLRLLMQTSDDVAVLVEAGVIVNGLDNNQAVVDLFSKLCEKIEINNYYFSGICEELTDYRSGWKGWGNICWKVLNDNYFTDFWRGTGTVAAVILLLLTLGQTITSILQVKQGANS